MTQAQDLASEIWEEKTSSFISAAVANHQRHLTAYQIELIPLLVMAHWWTSHRAGTAQEPQDRRKAVPEPGGSEIEGPAFPLLLGLLSYELKIGHRCPGPQQTFHFSFGLHSPSGPHC